MFDFAPLEQFARRHQPDLTDTDLADLLGAHRNSLPRWRKNGITTWRADALCCRLGVFPTEVYPDWCSARRVVREHLASRRVAA